VEEDGGAGGAVCAGALPPPPLHAAAAISAHSAPAHRQGRIPVRIAGAYRLGLFIDRPSVVYIPRWTTPENRNG
jgi:hypothetical protein